MQAERCALALTRALAYLKLSAGDKAESADSCRTAVNAVKRALDSGADTLFDPVLDQVEEVARDAHEEVPPSQPPLSRSSMFYGAARSRVEVPPERRVKAPWRWAARVRRWLFTLLVLGQTLIGSYYLLATLPYHQGTFVEFSLVALFAILFGWISAGFWMAIFGFVIRRFGGDPWSLMRRQDQQKLAATPLVPTAVVMPIYHEAVAPCYRRMRAIYRSIEETGCLEKFEFFVLSDSRDPAVWLAEQATWRELCRELGDFQRIHYRRRTLNLKHKSGNIADFLRRWGARFHYMIVLDADSLMTGETMVKMVQLMERSPQVGILQSNPAIVYAKSAFARAQQFANRLYGRIFSTGLCALQMGEAAYWGHNAIIRVAPFMRYCGLSSLPGIGLFRGPVLSHDFVEAAYISRAGYEVWLEPELGGSYEESPPTLSDELTRDRRWSKGNLQHLWLLIFGRRIRLAHRMAFLNGVLAYAASPLWFCFLALTTVQVAQFVLGQVNYFPSGHALFPMWPHWHPQWAIRLAGSTALILFLPKFIALFDACCVPALRRSFGGFWRLTVGVLLEILFSILLSPIRMLSHSRFVVEALFNLPVSWAGQNRDEQLRWGDTIRAYLPANLLAVAWAAFAYRLKFLFFLWSLPVAVPLILAAPVAMILGNFNVGERLRRLRILSTPEEAETPSLLIDYAKPIAPRLAWFDQSVEWALIDPEQIAVHRSLARERNGFRGTYNEQLARRCLERGLQGFSRGELSDLVRDRRALTWLHRHIWRAPVGSIWGTNTDRVAARELRRGYADVAKPGLDSIDQHGANPPVTRSKLVKSVVDEAN